MDEKDHLLGIFTDGDLRRLVSLGKADLEGDLSHHVTAQPTTLDPDDRVQDAEAILSASSLDQAPVLDRNHRVVGLVDVQDLWAIRPKRDEETVLKRSLLLLPIALFGCECEDPNLTTRVCRYVVEPTDLDFGEIPVGQTRTLSFKRDQHRQHRTERFRHPLARWHEPHRAAAVQRPSPSGGRHR